MSQQISLDKSLQAYRVLAAPAKFSWKQHFANEEFGSSDMLELDKYERKQFNKRLNECQITITPRLMVKVDEEFPVSTLSDLVDTITDPANKKVAKTNRKAVFSTSNGKRPAGNNAFLWWNGFQVIDMDIKDEKMAKKLKEHIFNSLYKCNWFLGVTLSASGQGLHIYTKIAVPEDMEGDYKKRKLLYLTNFRHKFSFVYIACLSAMQKFDFTKDDLMKWMDISMFRPAQGAFIGYDPHPLINTRFFEDFIYICFDNIEDVGHPEIDWVTYPDLKTIFSRWEYFEEEENSPEVNIENAPHLENSTTNKVHYKHNERWRLANTLVNIYGLEWGCKYMRMICSNNIPDKELRADCQTAATHKKPIDIWAVNRLNSVHGFKIKMNIEDQQIEEEELFQAMNQIENPNVIRKSKYTYNIDINRHQYLGDVMDQIIPKLERITLIEAGPGLGKTEMVKQLVNQGKKVMMILPFTSVIKSKVESEEGWYYAYGSRNPKLDVEHGLALTVDKFSRLNMMDIKAAGFDYIFLDESHLLFMSEYRPVMAKVIDLIRNTEVPIVLMSGTPTGELVFFPDVVHIHIKKEEVREKTLEVNMVDNTSTLLYHMCRQMAQDIAQGKRVLFPSNEGTSFSKKVKAGIEYFLQQNHAIFEELNLQYYKKSNLGDEWMDKVNFEKTITDAQVVMCTSFLSVGVDIWDRLNFQIYFGDLCTAAECDQWCNRLRANDLRVKMFIAKNDAEGNPRFINKFKPMNFKLDDEEIKDLHSILRICNGMIERNPTEYKYNSLVASIIQNNRFIVYDEIKCKYYVDEIAYKTVIFERKFRDYMQQLPVFMKGMQAYGYKISAKDLGEFNVTGSEVFRDLKNMIKLAHDNQLILSTTHIEELLDLINEQNLNIYRDVMKGKFEIKKGKVWKEDLNNMIMTVKDVEVFEKVVPIVSSMSKMFEMEQIRQIFEYCRNPNGSFNFAAINRVRIFINIIKNDEEKRLDLPIKEFMDESLKFAEQEEVHKNDLKKFIISFAQRYADRESTIEILISRAELTMKKLVDTFEKIFKSLIVCSRPGKDGIISMQPMELLWKRREFFSGDKNEMVYVLQDFLDAVIDVQDKDNPFKSEVIELEGIGEPVSEDIEVPF